MKKIALILVGLLLPCSVALSAGLGRLSVQSALGQPLRAEIEIVSLQSGEAETLGAALASAGAFRQANIDLNTALFAIRFAVERRPSGQFVVSLTSGQPINEPFIDMLVELSWSGGRLTREYTFLLDPPEYKGAATAAVVQPIAPPVVASPPVEPARPAAPPVPAQAPAPAVAAPAAAPAPAPAAPAARKPAAKPAAGTYEVKRGDTLAKIAQQTKPADVSLQQMLVSLYRANEDAFIGSNMNRLRAGRILNVPDKDAVAGISNDEARGIVNAQSSDYAAFRRGMGEAVASAPARADAGRQSSGRITPPAEPKAAPREAAKDQLRLSRPDDAKKGGRAAAVANGDDIAAKDQALKDARDRIALLEKNLEDMKRLAQLKSVAGAQIQETAKAAPAKAAEPAKAALEPAKAAAPKAPEPAKAPEAAKAAEVTAVAPVAPDVAKAAPPAEAPQAAASKAPAKAAPPPPPPTLMEELLDSDFALPGAGGLLVLLIGYAAYKWRRKKQLAQSESSVTGPEPVLASSIVGDAGSRSVDTGAEDASSFQSDFSQGGVGKIDSEEIDPVAEADVYMAYGRDAQAEEILKEALGKDPSRNAIRVKLLDIYSNRKDATAFEATARELHDATGGSGDDWARAQALGAALDPANPLYGGAMPSSGMLDTQVIQAPNMAADTPDTTVVPGAAGGETSAAAEEDTAPPALDFDLDLGDAPAEAAAQPDINLNEVSASADPLADTSSGLDFDLDAGTGETAPAEATAPDFSLDGTLIIDPAAAPAMPEPAPPVAAADDGGMSIDFDLGMDTPAAEAPAAPEPVAEAPADDGNMMDFKLDLDLPDGEGVADSEPAKPAPLTEVKPADIDLSALSLDLGASDAGAPLEMDAKWQEVATKLDLAKAYEDMGDKNGARELLNEVVAEGDAAQQAQAKSMLEALG